MVKWVYDRRKRSIISVFCFRLSCAIKVVRQESIRIHQDIEQEDIFLLFRFHHKKDEYTRKDSGTLKNQAYELFESFKTSVFQSKK